MSVIKRVIACAFLVGCSALMFQSAATDVRLGQTWGEEFPSRETESEGLRHLLACEINGMPKDDTGGRLLAYAWVDAKGAYLVLINLYSFGITGGDGLLLVEDNLTTKVGLPVILPGGARVIRLQTEKNVIESINAKFLNLPGAGRRLRFEVKNLRRK